MTGVLDDKGKRFVARATNDWHGNATIHRVASDGGGMSDTIPTPEELAEWRRLASEATPGPLHVEVLDQGYATERHEIVGEMGGKPGERRWPVFAEASRAQDAAFIAAAREALPRLIDAYDAGRRK